MSRDDEPLEPGTCGHGIGINSAGFRCMLTDDHDEHVWRGIGQASRGLGFADHLAAEIEVRWRDSRPAATVGDVRRALAARNAT